MINNFRENLKTHLPHGKSVAQNWNCLYFYLDKPNHSHTFTVNAMHSHERFNINFKSGNLTNIF